MVSIIFYMDGHYKSKFNYILLFISSPLFQMAQLSHLNELTGPRFFRLNQLEMETEFATKEEIQSNKRFRLIKLRDEGVPELKHYQMIPCDERLISEDVFQVNQLMHLSSFS